MKFGICIHFVDCFHFRCRSQVEVKKENGEGEEATEKESEVKEGEEEPAAEPVAEPDDIILDYEDGDEIPTEVDGRIPKYNCQRQVGISLIHKLDCYECYVCGRFFDTEKTSEIHTRTVTHHRNFVKFLNEKANDTKIAQKRAAAALEEIERKFFLFSLKTLLCFLFFFPFWHVAFSI